MRLGLGVKAGGDDGTTRELAWLKMIVKVELFIQRERGRRIRKTRRIVCNVTEACSSQGSSEAEELSCCSGGSTGLCAACKVPNED